ncbi:MAG: sporulation protein YqfD [Candidatus Coproplasma sp.]
MNNKVVFEVTATAETVLKKLAKAQIPVGIVKVKGAKVRFGTNREYIQKVFAIFKHPCYNTVIRRKSEKMLFQDFLKRRLGLIVGAVAFVTLCLMSQTLVLKVSITGNAQYLTEQVLEVAEECGVKKYTSCPNLDKPLLTSRITSLENVEFCSVTRKGWAIIIDVHVQPASSQKVNYSPLKAQRTGKIIKLTVLSGTPGKAEGDEVNQGDIIIGNYELLPDGTKSDCLAAGYVQIEACGSISLFYEEESQENKRLALASVALYADNVTAKSLKITPCEGGYYYQVDFTYLHVQAWNID